MELDSSFSLTYPESISKSCGLCLHKTPTTHAGFLTTAAGSPGLLHWSPALSCYVFCCRSFSFYPPNSSHSDPPTLLCLFFSPIIWCQLGFLQFSSTLLLPRISTDSPPVWGSVPKVASTCKSSHSWDPQNICISNQTIINLRVSWPTLSLLRLDNWLE
jgi:hypothetical protein